MRPPSLFSVPLVAMVVAPVPVCTISPLFVLARFETLICNWPALSVPPSFASVCAALLLAVMLRVPGVTTVALLVTTSPWVAVTAMLAALVWLLDTSTLAPCSVALPAARFVPLATSAPEVVTRSSPTPPSLPSLWMPAPSTPVLLPCKLPAVIAALRPAVALPSLVIAPPTATLTSFAPRKLPPLASEPA